MTCSLSMLSCRHRVRILRSALAVGLFLGLSFPGYAQEPPNRHRKGALTITATSVRVNEGQYFNVRIDSTVSHGYDAIPVRITRGDGAVATTGEAGGLPAFPGCTRTAKDCGFIELNREYNANPPTASTADWRIYGEHRLLALGDGDTDSSNESVTLQIGPLGSTLAADYTIRRGAVNLMVVDVGGPSGRPLPVNLSLSPRGNVARQSITAVSGATFDVHARLTGRLPGTGSVSLPLVYTENTRFKKCPGSPDRISISAGSAYGTATIPAACSAVIGKAVQVRLGAPTGASAARVKLGPLTSVVTGVDAVPVEVWLDVSQAMKDRNYVLDPDDAPDSGDEPINADFGFYVEVHLSRNAGRHVEIPVVFSDGSRVPVRNRATRCAGHTLAHRTGSPSPAHCDYGFVTSGRGLGSSTAVSGYRGSGNTAYVAFGAANNAREQLSVWSRDDGEGTWHRYFEISLGSLPNGFVHRDGQPIRVTINAHSADAALSGLTVSQPTGTISSQPNCANNTVTCSFTRTSAETFKLTPTFDSGMRGVRVEAFCTWRSDGLATGCEHKETVTSSGSSTAAISLAPLADKSSGEVRLVAVARNYATTKTYTLTVNQPAAGAQQPEVTIAAATPVDEGDDVTVTVYLSDPDGVVDPSYAVPVPLTVTADPGTSGLGQLPVVTTSAGQARGIVIPAGGSSATGTITTTADADTDNGGFTVTIGAVDIGIGTPRSAAVVINDTTGGGGVNSTSDDATLSALSTTAGSLSFSAGTTSYSLDVPYATDTVTVTPTVNHSAATVTVDGSSVTSGSASSAISLDVGSNTITVRVTAEDGSTTKDYVLTVTRAAQLQAPDPVTNIQLTHNGSSLDVSWAASDRATAYDVTYYGNGVNARAAWDHTGTSLTIECDSRYTDRRHCVVSTASYRVGVRAKNDAGESEWRDSPDVDPPGGPVDSTAPGEVSNIQVTRQGSGARSLLAVSWTAPPDADNTTRYDIVYTRDDGQVARGAWDLAAESAFVRCDLRTEYLNQHCVEEDRYYRVEVRAKAGEGDGVPSSAWRQGPLPPVAVSGVSVEHTGSELRASWNAPARAQAYWVTYDSHDPGVENTMAARRHPTNSITIVPSQPGATYWVGVRAENVAGFSAWVNSAHVAPSQSSTSSSFAAQAPAPVQHDALVSIEDAEAQESAGSITFSVTLDQAVAAPVSVGYSTASGTATAGTDFASTAGTLTFQAGQTRQTVTIQLFDDAVDEGVETFTVSLRNARPAGTVGIADATATGTVKNADPLQTAWLARFGRAVATQAVDALGERLERRAQGRAGDTESDLSLLSSFFMGAGGGFAPHGHAAGGAVPGQAAAPHAPAVGSTPMGSAPVGLSPMGAAGGAVGLMPAGAVGNAEPYLPSGSLLLPGLGGDRWTGWARTSTGHFSSFGGDLPLYGQLRMGIFGGDYQITRRLLAGVAVAHGRGSGSATPVGLERTYTARSSLTSVHPYVAFDLLEDVTLWGQAGYGRGRMALVESHATDDDFLPAGAWSTGNSLSMLAAGGRGQLPDAGGFTLAVRSDAFVVRTLSQALAGTRAGNLAAGSAMASRLRTALEGSRALMFAGRTFTPTLSLGVRRDAGDAETGLGVETGIGLVYADPSLGLMIDATLSMLVAHQDARYDEWGFSGSVRFDPGMGGRGLSLTLMPSFGAAAQGTDRLWGMQDMGGLVPYGGVPFDVGGQFAADLGYGMAGPGGRGTGTPYLGLMESGMGYRSLRYGYRWEIGERFNLELEGGRQGGFGGFALPVLGDPADGLGGAQHSVQVRGGVSF